MARKSSTTAGPTITRQRGYALTIKCFVPMGEGLAAQAAMLATLAEIETGDIESLSKMPLQDISVAAKQTSRKVETTA